MAAFAPRRIVIFAPAAAPDVHAAGQRPAVS
jgi:hypothetical protein